MSVAKMRYLNVYGPQAKLMQTLDVLAGSGCFAPESSDMLMSMRPGDNPYEPLMTKAKGLLKDLGQPSLAGDFKGSVDAYDLETVSDYLEKFAGQVASINKRRTQLQNELAVYTRARELLLRMTGLDVSFDELFQEGYLKVRIGRLPKTSYVRLAYYEQKKLNFTSYFNFTVYDFDGEYYWGLYFAPSDAAEEIDEIFASMYFERTRLPDFVHGRPQEALASVDASIAEMQQSLDELINPADIAAERDLDVIRNMTAWLYHLNQLYGMEKYAMVFNHTFYIDGFVPLAQYAKFKKQLLAVEGVKIKRADDTEHELPADPPVKLKNNWFARPYEMFTTMYGLPTYHDIDPTFIVSIIYSVLFGLMFADLGQGVVLGLFGYFYMYKRRKMAIGAVLARAGFFSALFGLLFGSVFGYEHLLDPLFRAVGFAGKPFEVMAPSSVNIILLGSVVIGVVVVSLAIITSIVSKLRRGHIGPAITGSSGFAGLVFYYALLGILVDMMLLHRGFAGPAYIALLIVLPVLVMYFQEPLNILIDERRLHLGNPVDLLVGGFFEMFVTLLEYLSNTVSFLRVGGFVLAHAGMMSVVETLAHMAGSAAPVVMVFGNVFVICLEGLIVGIQALRLNYYEVFSRFFDADGKAFEPLRLEADTMEM